MTESPKSNPVVRVQDLAPDDVALIACSSCDLTKIVTYRGAWQGIRLAHASPSASVTFLRWPYCLTCGAEGDPIVTVVKEGSDAHRQACAREWAAIPEEEKRLMRELRAEADRALEEELSAYERHVVKGPDRLQ